MRKAEDLTGQTFYRWTFLHEVLPRTKPRKWVCKCSCGTERAITCADVKRGKSKSCGCIGLELRTTHGDHKKRIHRIYMAMLHRCNIPTDSRYDQYGGRGIKVCSEWYMSYDAFKAWAMSNGYEDSLSIDRKNGDGDYEPSNCRWATIQTQSRNKRKQLKTTSQYIGVHWDKAAGKWVTRISVDSKKKHIGYAETEMEAALMRDSYITTNKLTDFTLNFPKEGQ